MRKCVCAVLLLGWSLFVAADQLASYRTNEYTIELMTEFCANSESGHGPKRAYKRFDEQHILPGCWSVNHLGNPMISWQDGQQEELDGSRVRMEPKYAALLREPPPRSRATERAHQADVGFARPFWCPNATHPHERLICRDADLATGDLALAPLWRRYREELGLSAADKARTKRDFFLRQKACGADKSCIAAQQDEQMRFYRDALAARSPGATSTGTSAAP